MRRTLLLAALLLALGGTAGAQSEGDERARALVDEMLTAMGGPEAWEQTRYLRFDWVVEREGETVADVKHLWDRYTGRYRVEWTNREGERIAALFSVNTRVGRALVNQQPVPDDEEQKYIDQAYARFINDSYWLLMPWKLRDTGVKLEYAGEKTLAGKTYDLVHVSFGRVGLTPGDRYWAYISRQSHLMERWAYFLQSFEGKPHLEGARPWEWRRWGKVGPLWLAQEKKRVGENTRIHFPVLLVLETVADEVFESFDVPMPGAGN
ncbi:MAG: hypothetical protein ACE5HB_05770 [Terriglobia bacterium]